MIRKNNMRTLTDKQTRKLSGIPASQRGVYQRAWSGKSPKAGIKANCLECMGNERKEVEICDTETCPMFPYRPFRKSKKHQKSSAVGFSSGDQTQTRTSAG